MPTCCDYGELNIGISQSGGETEKVRPAPPPPQSPIQVTLTLGPAQGTRHNGSHRGLLSLNH